MFTRRRRQTVPADQAARAPDGLCLYVIGDIHGEAQLLRQLLHQIESHARAQPRVDPVIVYVGDYIDRGLATAEAVDIASRTPAWAADQINLKGNHEAMLLRFLEEPAFGNDWRQYGGLETLVSYGVDVRLAQNWKEMDKACDDFRRKLPPLHLAFLRNLQGSAVVGDYFICHAGVRPGIPLERQREEDLLWIREPFLSSTDDFGKIVIHGHTPVQQPEVKDNRINVDTGAYLTGRLTCVALWEDNAEFLSVGRV